MFETFANREDILILASNVTWNWRIVSYRFICATVKLHFAPEESRDIVTRKFTQPRGSLLHELLPTVPPALHLRFAETLTNFFSFYLFFFSLVGKGREEKTDNSVYCTRCVRVEAGREEGGGREEIIWKIGNKERGIRSHAL